MDLNFITKSTNYLKNAFKFDVRALSLMRIGIGFILLVDLIIRSYSITAFFTNSGVLPIDILKQYNWNPYYFSLHTLTGDLWWQMTLFILNAICILFLIVGYHTRITTFICWVLLVSLQNRNPFILQGGDELLKLILLWAIFLPWGERYSLKKISYYNNQYFSLANIGYTFLIASVYFFSALLKTSPEWHADGTAIYYALSLDQIRMPLGTFIYQFPNLMKVLTHSVYYIELIAPILLILPIASYRIKLIGIISLFLLHVGIVSTLYVGLFYIIGIVSLIGLLPSAIINKFEIYFLQGKSNTIIKSELPIGNNIIFNFIYFIKNILLSLVIIYCIALNLSNIPKFPFTINDTAKVFGSVFRLEQNWGMFAPYILKDDGYYVFSGLTKDKKYIDVKHELDSVSFKKPKNLIAEFESDRWRKFSENYLSNNNNYMRPYYCKYLLKKWNKEHPEKHIIELTIFYMKEVSLPDYKTKPIEKLALCSCLDTEE